MLLRPKAQGAPRRDAVGAGIQEELRPLLEPAVVQAFGVAGVELLDVEPQLCGQYGFFRDGHGLSDLFDTRQLPADQARGISGVIGRNSNVAFTYPLDVRVQQIARLYRGDARGRSGHDDVPRVQRVHRRGELDQPLDVVDEILRVRILPQLAVHLDREIEVVGIADLVGGREPWPEYAVGIDRIAAPL